ncbi:MAG: hypothetical protein LBS92_00185 [Candidatus Methanoplasma sp.]|jgi:hypothetical protein|nr:hypothetical protein [Candidatus Methanoplasma sp.]
MAWHLGFGGFGGGGGKDEKGPSSDEILKVEVELFQLDPKEWSDEKIFLYRQSLIRHHELALSDERDMKNTGIGMISSILLALTIICAYALPDVVQSSSPTAYDFLVVSIASCAVSVVLFAKVVSTVRKPGIVFNLSTPICGIQGTKNIGALADFKEFEVMLLRYEVNEYESQLSKNRTKRIMMKLGQIFATTGIIILLPSLVILYTPEMSTHITKFVESLGQTTGSITPLFIGTATVIAAVIVSVFTATEASKTIKKIIKSESDYSSHTGNLHERAIECLKRKLLQRIIEWLKRKRSS